MDGRLIPSQGTCPPKATTLPVASFVPVTNGAVDLFSPHLIPHKQPSSAFASQTSRSPKPTRGKGTSRAALDNRSGLPLFRSINQQANPKPSLARPERGRPCEAPARRPYLELAEGRMRFARHIANTSKSRDFLTNGTNMSTLQNVPDPEGLAIAREIQNKARPTEIILGGSRAVGEHRPDSDVDLTAIAPDEDSAKRTEEILQELLEGKHEVPVVNVHTITRAEFYRLALQAQSFPGQAARYGVTPHGRSLDYRPKRNPTPEEIQELTLLWLGLAGSHMSLLKFLLEARELCHVKCLGKDAQWGLERAFKGLLAADNDPIWFRRDAAFLMAAR